MDDLIRVAARDSATLKTLATIRCTFLPDVQSVMGYNLALLAINYITSNCWVSSMIISLSVSGADNCGL